MKLQRLGAVLGVVAMIGVQVSPVVVYGVGENIEIEEALEGVNGLLEESSKSSIY